MSAPRPNEFPVLDPFDNIEDRLQEAKANLATLQVAFVSIHEQIKAIESSKNFVNATEKLHANPPADPSRVYRGIREAAELTELDKQEKEILEKVVELVDEIESLQGIMEKKPRGGFYKRRPVTKRRRSSKRRRSTKRRRNSLF